MVSTFSTYSMKSGFSTGKPRPDKNLINELEFTKINNNLNDIAPRKLVVNIFKYESNTINDLNTPDK